jgi:cytochrome b561
MKRAANVSIDGRLLDQALELDISNWHEVLGLSVLLLTVVRLLWRAAVAGPQLPSPRWMHVTSKLVQGLRSLLLLAVPTTAVTGAWLEGYPLTLGILGEVPSPIAKNHALGEKLAKLHTWLGDAILWVAGLHAAAALFHHFVLRDAVMLAMVPARWRPRQ